MLKQLFRTNNESGKINAVLLLLRVCTAAFLLTHGIPKLNSLLEGGEIKFADPIGLGPEMSLILVVFAEAFCSALIMIGLGTRLASIPLIINMMVIVFIVHLHDPFSRKELPLFYLIIFISLFVLGSGKYSFDHLIFNRISK